MTEYNPVYEDALRETSAAFNVGGPGADADIDLSLLEDSLCLTPWERMLANDDALNFAESLRDAMQRRHAKQNYGDAAETNSKVQGEELKLARRVNRKS
jgi:hypothetical protein